MLNIVLTGGPSSGKTTVINAINEYFSCLGYYIINVPEAATLAINSGIKPFGDHSLKPVNYQRIILMRQLMAEYTAKLAASEIGDKTIIVYDRGTLDGYAYVSDEEWEEVLHSMNLNKRDLLCAYDAVFYLEGSSSFFTKENNAARYENDANEALEKGRRVLKSYLSHDNLMVIQPRENIDDKQHEVVSLIQNMLGCPTQLREQRKFLVADLDIDELAKYANKVSITQNYLSSDDENEYRLRAVRQDKNVSYHYSVQKKLPNGIRHVVKEEVLSLSDYEKLLELVDPNIKTVYKNRYSFVYADQYFKLDIFPDGLMVLEVNVTKENPLLSIPPFIKCAREVSDDPNYDNKVIAGGEGIYAKRKINRY